jgi:hypothetical protein
MRVVAVRFLFAGLRYVQGILFVFAKIHVEVGLLGLVRLVIDGAELLHAGIPEKPHGFLRNMDISAHLRRGLGNLHAVRIFKSLHAQAVHALPRLRPVVIVIHFFTPQRFYVVFLVHENTPFPSYLFRCLVLGRILCCPAIVILVQHLQYRQDFLIVFVLLSYYPYGHLLVGCRIKVYVIVVYDGGWLFFSLLLQSLGLISVCFHLFQLLVRMELYSIPRQNILF